MPDTEWKLDTEWMLLGRHLGWVDAWVGRTLELDLVNLAVDLAVVDLDLAAVNLTAVGLCDCLWLVWFVWHVRI